MSASLPKQYLPLAGSSVIQQTLDRLLTHTAIEHVHLALAADDRWWPAMANVYAGRVSVVTGGRERVDSVRNVIRMLNGRAAANDWLLVHDVARPCLRHADLDRLLEAVREDAVGGLLGGLVTDTVKRSGADGRVHVTVSRENLWRAYTPQVFRFGLLQAAIDGALAAGVSVTDEAGAMEWAGHRPLLVRGEDDNLKVTFPRDLQLAELYLERLAIEEKNSA